MTAKAPTVAHAYAKSIVKGEDLIFVEPRITYPAVLGSKCEDSAQILSFVRRSLDSAQEGELDHPPRDPPADTLPLSKYSPQVDTYGLYCVFDGHNGVGAASHACQGMAEAVHDRMPGPPPPETDLKRYRMWREQLQHALVGALSSLHESFACDGEPAGCTATIVLQCGWIVTVANLGDSRALLDTGAAVQQVTVDHRVATHKGERRRLEASNVLVAPIDMSGEGPAAGPSALGYGPLRMWPGGLCLSRALGDFDVGASVLCAPHVYQVKLPASGARLIMASDGVWDAFDSMTRVGVMARPWTNEAAPNKIIQAIRRAHGGLRDDTSVIVADFLPPGSTSFPEMTARRKAPRGGSSSGMACLCMSRPQTLDGDEPAAAQPLPVGKLDILVDMDVAALAGLLPDVSVPDPPSWYSDVLGEDLREIQLAAVEAWTEVRKMRTTSGKVPSRDDLAGYFARAHKSTSAPVMPDSPAAVTDRTPHPMDYTVKFGATPSQLAATVHKVRSTQGQPAPTQGPASNHYEDNISSMASYGRHFGHYAGRPSADSFVTNDTHRYSPRSSSSSDRPPGTPPTVEEEEQQPDSPAAATRDAGVADSFPSGGSPRASCRTLESIKSDRCSGDEKIDRGDACEHRVKLGRNVLMQSS